MISREEELVRAIRFLSSLLALHSMLLIDITQKMDEIGQSFIAWQSGIQSIQKEYDLDLDKVMEIVNNPPNYKKGKEYLN